MRLTQKLKELREDNYGKRPDDINQLIDAEIARLAGSGIIETAPKKGDKLADFNLPNQNGKYRHLSEFRAEGAVVVLFYRGGWCPYCNLELRVYQEMLEDIKKAGGSLVAITPELPDSSLSTIEKNELQFEVLTDQDMKYAKEIGIAFNLPQHIREIYDTFGLNLEEYNGKDGFDLPLAATFVIDKDGMVYSSYVKADYTYRKDPTEVISELKLLANR